MEQAGKGGGLQQKKNVHGPHPILTFQWVRAKFFWICSLTEPRMSLSKAASPEILGGGQGSVGEWKVSEGVVLHSDPGTAWQAFHSPKMLQGLLAGEPLLGVSLQKVPDEVFGWSREARSAQPVALHLSLPPPFPELGVSLKFT